jgi:hypothetical protein
VGATNSGPGSGSGGDVDTDITGVGFGGAGLAQSGPEDPDSIGAAESDGTSDEFASGSRARGQNQNRPPQILRPADTIDRSTGDEETDRSPKQGE